MARGSIRRVNRALVRPILVAGVEKRFALFSAMLSFPLIAATHFHLPAALVGVGFYIVLHMIFVMLAKYDPMLGKVLKRSTRTCFRSYFPAHSHPSMTSIWKIRSVSRPK